jgi:mortality factor 4-like protein 1
VVQIKDGKFYIHYTGWEATWDEWVPKDRIRFVTDKNPDAKKR